MTASLHMLACQRKGFDVTTFHRMVSNLTVKFQVLRIKKDHF